jgi:hypothetical protein
MSFCFFFLSDLLLSGCESLEPSRYTGTCFQVQLPAQHKHPQSLPRLLHGQVNRFGNSAADKWLCSAHHTDMAMRMNKTLPFFRIYWHSQKRAGVHLSIRSSFEHHGAAYIIIGGFDLVITKT